MPPFPHSQHSNSASDHYCSSSYYPQPPLLSSLSHVEVVAALYSRLSVALTRFQGLLERRNWVRSLETRYQSWVARLRRFLREVCLKSIVERASDVSECWVCFAMVSLHLQSASLLAIYFFRARVLRTMRLGGSLRTWEGRTYW